MMLKMILTRSQKQRTEDTQKARQKLNNLDIENIGTIDGTEYAKRLKLLAEKFAEVGRMFDLPEVIALFYLTIFNITKFKKEPEVKRGKWVTSPNASKSLMCSLCGAVGDGNIYCGHCGAKMEGGAEE